MNTRGCCNLRPVTTDGSSHPSSLARRCFDSFGWMGPGALLVLLPKCPMCFAAYVALVTGIGLSAPAAAHSRMLLVILCIASLVYFLSRRALRFISRAV